jgi:hypothetical protein
MMEQSGQPINVFFSVGRTMTPSQHEFVAAIETLLAANGFLPRTVGRTDLAQQKPLQLIADVMRECSGTIVVALERLRINQGVELCGDPTVENLSGISLPTVWTQIEAAIAYTLGHPLLAIVESNLRNEGVLEEGYDWTVKWVDLDPQSLNNGEFSTVLGDWKNRVLAYHARQNSPKPE